MKTLLISLLLAAAAIGQTVSPAAKDGSNITNPAFRNAVLPSQASQSGKYLKTDGTAATWESVTADLTSGPVTSSGGVSSITDGALALSKLAQTSATANQVIKWNGSAWAPAADSGGISNNAELNTTIAADSTASLHAIGAPRQSMTTLNTVSALASDTRITTTLHTRGLRFGDSIEQNAQAYLHSTIGFGGRIVGVNEAAYYTLASGAAVGAGAYNFDKSINGSYINLATGTATFNGVASTTRPLFGRQIQVWYWSETGGGTFKVQKNSVTATSTYTDLIPDNAGTAPGTTAASATIDAAEGGATGAFRCLTYTMTNYEFVNVRTTGLSGSAKIVAVGAIEVPDQRGSRLTGYADINCAVGGSEPSQWDNITDAALSTLLNTWNPSVVFFRGYETLSQWQNEWTVFVGRIRAIKPDIEVIVTGMHNTGDSQPNTLDATDAYLQDWCDSNNGVYIPIRNRLGTFKQNLATGLYSNPQSTIKTISGGVSATGVITVTPAINSGTDGYTVGKYVRLTALTGGNGLSTYKNYEPYRILEIPSSTTLKLAAFDGVTPATFSTDITAGTMDLYDTTHPSADGVAVINNLIAESLMTAGLHEAAMRGNFRKTFSPATVQWLDDHSGVNYAGPAHKWRSVSFSRVDGGQSATAYPSTSTFGAKQINNNDVGVITGPSSAGFGMAWDSNYGVLGDNPANFTRGLNANGVGRAYGDKLEIYNGNAGLTTLAISKAGTASTDAPFVTGRIGASSSSKGSSEVWAIDAIGRAKFAIPSYADDAAADADAALPSGYFYKITGSRAVYQKP